MSKNPARLFTSSFRLLIDLVLNDDHLTSLDQVKSNLQYVEQLPKRIQGYIGYVVDKSNAGQKLNPSHCWLKGLLILKLVLVAYTSGFKHDFECYISKHTAKLWDHFVDLADVKVIKDLIMSVRNMKFYIL